MNFITLLLAGFIPLLTGFLWYNDAFGFGKIWMKENGFTDEFLKKDFNPLKVFGISYVFGVMLAFAMMPMVIHQMGLFSMSQFFYNDAKVTLKLNALNVIVTKS